MMDDNKSNISLSKDKSTQFIKFLPKVELHVHLEGSVNPAFMLNLLKQDSNENEHLTLVDVKERFEFKNFVDFIETFKEVIRLIRTPNDIYNLTNHFLDQAAEQNIRYCEVMFTPWFLTNKGMDFFELMAEVDRAAKEREKTAGIEMKLILDGPRNMGKKVVREVFTMAMKDKTGRVIGVGLGGDEQQFPAHLFIEEFEYARASGLKTIAHAGENDGEQSMIDAIQLLKVKRLGHCLGIKKNSELETMIFHNHVTLDLCPWSNVETGAINSIGAHPFCDYLKRGYPVTLNSDDPGFFKTTLNREYQTMFDQFDITLLDLTQVSKNAVSGSFLSSEKKRALYREIEVHQKTLPK